MENAKIAKPLTKKNRAEYLMFSLWCNNNNYIIKDDNPKYYYCQKTLPYKPNAQEQILMLEANVTPRRLREAALGDFESIKFIKNVDAKIEALRLKLSEAGK